MNRNETLVRRILARTWGRLVLVAACGLLAGATNTVLFALTNASIGKASFRPLWIASFCGLAVLIVLTNALPRLLLSGVTRGMTADVGLELARDVIATPLRRLEEIGRARVLTSFNYDLNQLILAFGELPNAVTNLTIVLGCLGYLLWLSRIAFWLTAPILVSGAVVNAWAAGRMQARFKVYSASLDELSKAHLDLLDGVKELKLNAPRKDAFIERVLAASRRRNRDEGIRLDRNVAILQNLSYSYTWLCVGIAAFVVPRFVADAEAARGAVLAILYTTGLLLFVGGFSSNIARARISLSRIAALRGELTGEPEGPVVIEECPSVEIETKQLVFEYPKLDSDTRPFVVGPFDFTFRSSEIVFIVGGNGSGKTTFAKLLCGLYAPTSGEIVWNGQPVDDARRESFRNLFSAVFWEFHVFGETVTDVSASADEYARTLLEKLLLRDKVDVRDGRLTTTNLSTGQKKRLALLVALLDDRPCYLFDEWAADQDPEFRAIFYHEILPELARRGKAVVAISHDDRYFGIADRIVTLSDGKVVPAAAMRAAEKEPLTRVNRA